MLTIKSSAAIKPEVNLRSPYHKTKTWLSMAPHKNDQCLPKIFLKLRDDSQAGFTPEMNSKYTDCKEEHEGHNSKIGLAQF